jgi:hypothetical protein
MEDNSRNQKEEVFSKRIKAGKRTYFIDVKSTRGEDYYITITESKKKLGAPGYVKHKIFLYKEDFNKFLAGLNEAVDHVKTELIPDFDFEKFNHEGSYTYQDEEYEEVEEIESEESASGYLS